MASSVTLTNTTTVSDCQTLSGQIPGDQREQLIDGYGWKDFEKRKVLRREWKLDN